MLTEAQIAFFKANGFVNGGQVLSEAEVDELRAELERVIADKEAEDKPQPVRIVNLVGDEAHPVWQIVNIWMASEPYKRLTSHPQITKGLAQLTDATELRIWHDQIQYKPAEIGGVNMWHQDAPLWPIIAPMTEVTAWVALDDVDEANGCMSMIPGSHLWGNHIDFLNTLENYQAMPDKFEGHALDIIRCPVKKGGGSLSSRPGLARLTCQYQRQPSPGDCPTLHDSGDPLRCQRQPRDETLCHRGRRRSTSRRILPAGLPEDGLI